MLISDDHDTRRAIARYGAHGALAASTLVFTLPGAPMLYNGMEVGDTTPSSGPALFEKEPIFWPSGQIEPEFPAFYRVIVPLRKDSPALRHGIDVTPGLWHEIALRDLARFSEPGMPNAHAPERPSTSVLPALSLPSFGARIFRDPSRAALPSAVSQRPAAEDR